MAKRPVSKKTSSVARDTGACPDKSFPSQAGSLSEAGKNGRDVASEDSMAAPRALPSVLVGSEPRRTRSRFVPLRTEQFGDLLQRVYPERRITSIHLHVSECPSHAEDRGRETLEAMWRFQIRHLGLADIAQHLTIDGHGIIWTGRHWERPPVSVLGHNGNAESGPLMITLIGDFRPGSDHFGGAQRDAAVVAVALLQNRFALGTGTLEFAWHLSSRQVPAEQIADEAFRREVDEARQRLSSASRAGAANRRSPFDDSAVDHGDVDQAVQLLLERPHGGADAIQEIDARGFTDDELVLLSDRPRRKSLCGAAASKAVLGAPYSQETKGVSMSQKKRWEMGMSADRVANSVEERGGSRKALCIGINAYARKPLSGCVNDARAWMKCLQGLGFQVETLFDSQATLQGMLGAIRRLVQGGRAGDVIVVQCSSHGSQIPNRGTADESDGLDEAVVPIDVERSGFLIDDDLAEINNLIPAGVNVTYFMDCCHSGTITRMGIGPDETEEVTRFLIPTVEMLEAHRRARGTRAAAVTRSTYSGKREVLFSACRAEQTAKERNGQGDFTRNALRVLSQGLSGVTNAGFIDSVRKLGGFNEQEPQLWSDETVWDAPLLGAPGGVTPPLSPASPAGTGDAGSLDDAIAKLDAILGQLRVVRSRCM